MSVDLSRIKRVESGLLSVPVIPDWRGLIDCIRRKGTPERVHLIIGNSLLDIGYSPLLFPLPSAYQ